MDAPRGEAGFDTVVDSLRLHSKRAPHWTVSTFLPDGGEDELTLTLSALDARARAVAVDLLAQVAPGSRVLLLFPPGREFIVAFFGCLYAGIIAVPTYLPHPAQRDRGILRLAGIAEDAQPAAVLTTSEIRAVAETATSSIMEFQDLSWLTVDTIPDHRKDEWSAPELRAGSVAFLQYTSGSTGRPKGVIVTHESLNHNLTLIRGSLGLNESSVIVGWLPPYHDMGLISMIILPAAMGAHSVLMPTVAFLQSPVRWLRAISKYRGTASVAPNFAFDLCARKITDEDRASLDLSSLDMLANGAEPIRMESLRRFSDAFASAGLRPEALTPVYGLAESTLLVSGSQTSRPPLSRAFDASALEHGLARRVSEGDPNSRVLVSCGVSQDLRVAIVDPQELVRCEPGRVGEIWISGGSVAAGYWQRPDLTQEIFEARLRDGDESRFLRTGDLGFQTEEGLFVVGRIKDVIIVGGQNHHPHDIEWTAERSHPRLRPGCVAAFGVDTDEGEALVLAAELRRADDGGEDRPGFDEVASAIRRAVMREHQLAVRDVVLLPAGSLPKTSSGKLERGTSRKEYLAGRAPWDRRG